MDWNEIIIALLGGTTVGGVVEAVRFRRQNRMLKDAEATNASVDAQQKQLNLAEDYTDKVLKLSEQIYNATLKNGLDNQAIIEKVNVIAREQRNIVEFLNGDYQSFLHQKQNKQ